MRAIATDATQQSQQQQQQQQLLDSSQESPSTSCQIASSSQTAGDKDNKRLDLRAAAAARDLNQSEHQLEQLDSSGRYSNSNGNHYDKHEDQSLLSTSGYRSQASVEFSHRSQAINRTILSTSESRRLIDKTFCGCCARSSPTAPIMSRSSRLVLSYFLAEMLGTFILVVSSITIIFLIIMEKQVTN